MAGAAPDAPEQMESKEMSMKKFILYAVLVATTGASGPYTVLAGEPTVCVYRLKLVLGDAESDYVETPVVVVEGTWRLYFPLIRR